MIDPGDGGSKSIARSDFAAESQFTAGAVEGNRITTYISI